MKYLKLVFISVVILTLLVIFTSIWLNVPQKEYPHEPITPVSTEADASIEKFSYREMKGDKIEWELEADKADYFGESDLMVFSDVRVIFYSKEGDVYTLEAKEGRYNKTTGNVEVLGDVLGKTSEGYAIKSSSLKYAAEVRQLITDDRVVITGPDIKIEGAGLLIDIEKNLFSLKNNVNTSLLLH